MTASPLAQKATDAFNAPICETDPEIAELLDSELGRQRIRDLLEHLQPVALQGDHLLTFQSDIHICIIPASSRDCNVLANIFLGLRKKCLISAGPKNQAASTSFADAA